MRNIVLTCAVLFILLSCTRSHTPKPRGILRIEPPAVHYIPLDEVELPYTFSVSEQTTIELPPTDSANSWLNIDYPDLQAKIYCSYHPVTDETLNEHIEDYFELAEKTAGKDALIFEIKYENKEKAVYGTLLLLERNPVSPIQFMLTDSVSHFFRGALYYNQKINTDSIAPVTRCIQNDITELIQTFYWKK